LLIGKKYSKTELLQDAKIQHYAILGDSIQFLKRKNALLKVGVYVGRFPQLTAKDVVFLSLAKTKCNILIVLLESDYSVRLKKEKSIVQEPMADRAFLVSSLPFVDWVGFFDEEHPELAIQSINPDYIFTGLYSDDHLDIKTFQSRIVEVEHPFEVTEKPKKKISLKYFDLPTE
jgi:bifunctional ADP-heptose synthase (sugar kinase/adenylyltransferase)